MIMDQHMADVDADVDVDVDVDVDIEVEAADQRPQSQSQSQPQSQPQSQSQSQSPSSHQRQQPQSQQPQPQQHQLHPHQQSPTQQPQPTTPLIRATSPSINIDGVNTPPGTGAGGTAAPTIVPLSPYHHHHPQAHKIGPLWIRRQLFEHSVAVPILTTANATQIDFSRLAAELHAASVTKPPSPPAVTYDDWVAAAGLYARLDSSEHAAIIVEALETNAPDAFLRCNGNDAAKLNSPDHLPFRQLLIPVPELLAFLKLHAAATVSSSYRNVADSVWPMSEDLSFAVSNHNNNINNNNNSSLQHVLGYHKSSNILAPISLTPASPRIIQPQQPGTPTRQSPVAFAQPQGHNISNSNSNAPHNSPVSSSPPSLTKSILEAAGNEHLFSSLQAQQQQQSPTTASQSDVQAQHKQSQQQSALKQQSAQRQQPQSPSAVHSPSSQRQQTQPPSNQSSPHQQLLSSPVHGASGNNFEGLVSRKKTVAHMSPVMNSQSVIMASGHHPLERETRLVVTNLKALLLVIAGAYGIFIDDHGADDKAGQNKTPANRNSNNNATNGPSNNNGAAESGSLTSNDKSQQQISSPASPSAPDSTSDPTLHGQNNANSSDTGAARTGLDAVMADSTHVSSNASTGSKGKKQSVNQIRITRQMFEHLSFLFTTSSEPSGAYRPMSKIVPLWNNNKNNGPHPNSDANINNVDGDISAKVNLTSAEHDENRGPIIDDDNSGKENDDAIILPEMMSIVTTALTMVPTQEVIDQSGGGVIDVVDLCDLERKTVVRTSMPLTNQAPLHPSDVRIVNCHDVHIYLLCSLGRVSFVGCRGCTLFVGGCVSLSLINCENVRVHAVARVVRVTNCFDTHLYLCTNNRPKIVGENRGLVFAPYNAVYPRTELNKHLEVVGVDVRRNIWDQFYQPALKCSTASAPSGNGTGSGGANSNNFNNSNNMNNNNIPGNDDNSCKNNNSSSSNNSSKQQHSDDRTPSNASAEMAPGNGNEISPVIARKMAPDQFLPFAVPVRYLEGTIIGEGMDEISMGPTDDDSTCDNNGSDVNHGVGKEDKLSNIGAGARVGGVDGSGDRVRRKWDSSLKCLFGVWVPLPSVYADNLKQKRSLVVKVREEIRDIERKWLGGNVDVTTDPNSNVKVKDVAMGDKDEDEGRNTQHQQVDNDSVDGSDGRERQHTRHITGGIVHSIIQDRFREWLTHSGRIRQISDLFRMVQE